MKKIKNWEEELNAGHLDDCLVELYVDRCLAGVQKERYQTLLAGFREQFGEREVALFSAPGRSEIAGNHTDHQRGEVLAASVNLDAVAVAAPSEDGKVHVFSEGYGGFSLDVSEIDKRKEEEGSTVSLIRGMLAGMKQHGYPVHGFMAYLSSNVLNGAGLSSSAAFEVLIGNILSGLFCENGVDPIVIAQIAQYAEKEYFGKPCGLMDQMACSVGGLIYIDFANADHPIVEKVPVDFSVFQHSLCITDTKGSHANLTEDYAAVPEEMRAVAQTFGKSVLREVKETEFYGRIPELRKTLGDRPVLRAIHFFSENQRVREQVSALKQADFARFKRLVQASGDSSFRFLQNVYTNKDVQTQNVSIALALSEHVLEGVHGVSRVHGGGFAGTIQAFVEDDFVDEYRRQMDAVFGTDACHVLKVRPYGGVQCFERI